LFFARTAGAVVLSNVLNAVRAHPGVSSRLNPEAVASFLQVGWNQDLESTTFADIRRVPPGHLLRIVDGEVTVTRHWSLPDPPPIELADDAEYTERYRALLETAVAERLAPDRTVLFLSGGIDSPTIAAAAVSGGHGAELATVTIRNREVETETESRLAAAVAERLRLRHRLLEYALAPTPEDPPATPEPYDDPEYRATTAFYREVSAGASVVIEGEDGDALFSPPSFLHQARQHGAFAVLRRFAAYTIGHGRRPYLGFWLRRRIAGVRRPLRPHVAPWLVGAAAAIPDRPTSAVSHRARPEAATSLTSSIWQCVHDGCSQAYHGTPFEFRWPLLDTRLIEFVFSIPPVPWCQRKWLARRAYAARLPAQVLTRDKTTVPGYYERLVAAWRARTGGRVDLRAPATAEFVDAGRLTTALAATDTETVMAAWRAIEFDRWVHAAGLR
jgi:asparagine synthase (glutamine-hydrolysing)